MKMAKVDPNLNQQTLDSLRATRGKLYAIPESELSAMSLDDQLKYGDSLHQNGMNILRLEAIWLKAVNDQFKEKEEDLKNAATKLESDTAELTETVKIVRVASQGIGLITNIIKLLSSR